jgi:hypothetical protein
MSLSVKAVAMMTSVWTKKAAAATSVATSVAVAVAVTSLCCWSLALMVQNCHVLS